MLKSKNSATKTLLQETRKDKDRGKNKFRLSLLAQALADAADPADDLEGSAEYKRHLIGVYLKRAFAKALA